jgi:hypothetical protein
LVAALRTATGATPVVTGKPEPTMHRETVVRSKAQAPLVVGDRLDTDIEGANATGCPSLLVLSGVTSPRTLLSAEAVHRPTFISWDLSGLLRAHPPVAIDRSVAVCGAWTAAVSGSTIRLDRAERNGAEDGLDALRAMCAAVWAQESSSTSGEFSVESAGADDVLEQLQLG